MRDFITIGLASLALLGGCSSDKIASEPVGDNAAPIIGGTLDTTHQAVVTWFSSSSWCSGTIIHVADGYGYVLTAAHCFAPGAPVYVAIGDDNQSPSATLDVVHSEIHPQYDSVSSTYDFAIMRASGATSSTPFIPAMSPPEDAIVVGTQLDHVGYGLVSWPSGSTTQRHHLVTPASDVYPTEIEYQQATGGPCSGDSGGPQLVTTGGGERVGGVTSYGDEECVAYGISGRVAAVYDTFIAPYIGVPSSSSGTGGTGGGGVGGAGGDPSSGGSGAGTSNDGSWIAGDAEKQDYSGEIMSSCSVSEDGAPSRAPWIAWLLATLGACHLCRRRSA